jgi:hypothetical protein
MNINLLRSIIAVLFVSGFCHFSWAGNPDRQGEAGAYELLINPWAKGASLYSLNVSRVKGVEATTVNPAGIGRLNKQEALMGHTRWLVPSGINVNAFGYSNSVGKSGAFAVSVMALSFGDIRVTTTSAPEGTGATYSPTFFNLGLGYSQNFGEKVSVGILLRGINESIADLNAFGFSIDAGVQYVSGKDNNFKLGIALRNVGGPMKFRGDGLSTQLSSPEKTSLTYDVRLSGYELPSLLHLGLSYDVHLGSNFMITPIANFTANSFGKDILGAGVELEMLERISIRASYALELGTVKGIETDNVYKGIGLGAGINYPLDKKGNTHVSLDYAYRPTDPFQGTHNIGIGLTF